MQELLHNVSRQLLALLTPEALLQLAAIAIAILLAWWFGRQVRNTDRARAALVQTGFQARFAEAITIASPYLAAVVVISAWGGVLHAFKTRSDLVDLAITLSGLMLLIKSFTDKEQGC